MLLALLALGPAFADGYFPGVPHVDYHGTLWFYWFLGHQLQTGGSLLHTDLFFYPYGKDILGHTGANLLDAALALPFRAVLGPVWGYTLFVGAGLVAGAWAFARLAADYTKDQLAILTGTVLFLLSPYALVELGEGRPTQGLLVLLPLALRAMLRAQGPRAAAWGGVLLALCGYQYWFYGLFGAILALLLGGWRRETAILLGTAALLVAPVAAPMILHSADGAVSGLLDTSALYNHLQPITADGHPIALSVWQPLRLQTGFYFIDGDLPRFLPVVRPLALATLLGLGLALWRPGPVPRRLWWGILGLGLLAMGPVVIAGGHVFLEPLYQLLISGVSFLRRLWWPARAMAWVAVLVPICITGLIATFSGWRRWALSAALGLGSVVEVAAAGLLPLPTWSPAVPAGYQCLAQAPAGAVLELPYGRNQAHLYYQTTHAKPIFGGMLELNPSFIPPEMQALQQQDRALRVLLALPGEVTEELEPADIEPLYQLGYRYIVLQKDLLTAPDPRIQATQLRSIDRLLGRLFGAPVYDDARLRIYAPWGERWDCDGARDTEKLPSYRTGYTAEEADTLERRGEPRR